MRFSGFYKIPKNAHLPPRLGKSRKTHIMCIFGILKNPKKRTFTPNAEKWFLDHFLGLETRFSKVVRSNPRPFTLYKDNICIQNDPQIVNFHPKVDFFRSKSLKIYFPATFVWHKTPQNDISDHFWGTETSIFKIGQIWPPPAPNRLKIHPTRIALI